MKKTIVALTVLSLVSACAQEPSQIQAMPVSTATYTHLTCQQLQTERANVVNSVNKLTAVQKDQAQADAVAMGIGMVLFWPALFALSGSKDNSAALAQAKGQYDAIDAVQKSKRCI